MNACTTCARTLTPDLVRDGRHACRTCTDTTRAALAEIPVQLAALRACLEPGSTGPRTGSLHGTRDGNPPLREDALALLAPGTYRPGLDPAADAPATALLAGWGAHTAAHTGYHAERRPDGSAVIERWATAWPRHLRTAESWCDWLTAYLPTTARHPWYRQMHRDLDALLTRMRRITLLEPWERALDAPCPHCRAYALLERWGEPDITCTLCGHTLTHDQYRTHAADHARTRLNTITRQNEQTGQDGT